MVTLKALDVDTRSTELALETVLDLRDGHFPAARTIDKPAEQTADKVVDLRDLPDDAFEVDSFLRPYQTAHRLSSEAEILAARRLHAEVFVASGFISIDDVDPDGTVDVQMDPWSDTCEYFAVLHEDVAAATARQIGSDDPSQLPALGLADLADDEVRRICDLPAGAAVEISALARRSGTPSSDVVAVYVQMWRASLLRGHRVWVMSVDVRVFGLLRALLCGKALRRIGPDQEYMGSAVVPAVMWFDEVSAEHHRLSETASSPASLRSLLPRLFPYPAGAVL